MCYNLNKSAPRRCKIKINSSLSDEISAFGTIEEAEGKLNVLYTLDGDDCALTYSDGKAEQTRRGGQNVKISFERGEKTFCEISSGAFSGGFEIFTESLEFISGRGGIRLGLGYVGADGEAARLTFTAAYIEQEKK